MGADAGERRAVAKVVALILLAPVALYLFACLMLYATQRNYLFFPVPRHDTSVPTLALPSDAGPLVVSTRPRDGAQALVYFGGNAEDVSMSVPTLARAFPDHAIYALHYRGYGGSPGEPGEAALVADGLALFDLAKSAHAQVVVIGRSLGSGVAVQVAGARPVERLVLVTPYDSLVAVAGTRFPMFPVGLLMRDRFDSAAIAPRLTLPTAIVVAQRDEVITYASSQRLYDAFAQGVATFTVIPMANHNDISGRPGYEAALRGGQ
jgi:fermentation-respiration switch protein FrsA (DUF1100 family)